MEESEETVEKYDIEEDVDALFGGEELSEEFKESKNNLWLLLEQSQEIQRGNMRISMLKELLKQLRN